MKLTKQQAQDLVYSGSCSDLNLEVEADERIEDRRWVSLHALVVKDAVGKFWETTYERGLTEYQDIAPFEDESEVIFWEVEKVPVTTYEYHKVNVKQ